MSSQRKSNHTILIVVVLATLFILLGIGGLF